MAFYRERSKARRERGCDHNGCCPGGDGGATDPRDRSATDHATATTPPPLPELDAELPSPPPPAKLVVGCCGRPRHWFSGPTSFCPSSCGCGCGSCGPIRRCGRLCGYGRFRGGDIQDCGCSSYPFSFSSSQHPSSSSAGREEVGVGISSCGCPSCSSFSIHPRNIRFRPVVSRGQEWAFFSRCGEAEPSCRPCRSPPSEPARRLGATTSSLEPDRSAEKVVLELIEPSSRGACPGCGSIGCGGGCDSCEDAGR